MCIALTARPEGLLESAWYEISEAKGNAFIAVLLNLAFFSTIILAEMWCYGFVLAPSNPEP